MSPWKQMAAWAYRWLISLYTAAVVAEIFLAGLGVFRAMPGDNTPISHKAFDAKFDTHAALGGVLAGGSLLLLIVILVARPRLRWIGATVGLAVLTVVQGALAGAGDNAPVAGAFHAINAVVIFGLSTVLTLWAWRGSLLAPPTRAPLIAPPPAAISSTSEPGSNQSRPETGARA